MSCLEMQREKLKYSGSSVLIFLSIFWIILVSCMVTTIFHFLRYVEGNVSFMPKYGSFIKKAKFGIFLPISDGQ